MCVTALCRPDGTCELFDGEVLGEIGYAPRGEQGFGYDPVFVIAGDGRTMAEPPSGEKHRISHRGLAGAKLLALLDGVTDRRSRFVCVTALCRPDGACELFDGEVIGEISYAPRGEQGFGYDPVFVIGGDGRTMAELPSEEKHRISHRGIAGAKLRARLAVGS